MSFEFKLEPRDGYLHAEVWGPFDLAQVKQSFPQLLEACRSHGLAKVLIDARKLTGEIDTMSRFEFGQFIAGAMTTPIEIVMLAAKEHLWPDRFVENVAQNRGVLYRVTADPKEALEWIQPKPQAKNR